MLMMMPPLLRYFWFHSIYSLAASCSLQSAVCSLQSAVCKGHTLPSWSGSPLGSQAFQLGCSGLQVGRLSTSDEEVFCPHANLSGLLLTKLGYFSFWVRQKPTCCLVKPIKVFVPLRFKTRTVSNATELFRV